MKLSLVAGKIGAIILWLQASAGEAKLIGNLGGTRALCDTLNEAVREPHNLEGAYGLQGIWVCAAMWRLSFTPSNAEICLENSTPALLASTQQTGIAQLSAAALQGPLHLLAENRLQSTVRVRKGRRPVALAASLWVLCFGPRRERARVRFVRALAAGSRMKNLWRPACAVRSAVSKFMRRGAATKLVCLSR